MTPTQREAIELAIADFEHIPAASGHVEFVERRIAALRAALAQPAPVQEQQPAPASKPVLLQCLGCERVGTQEQLSASTDCDCWLHTQPAPPADVPMIEQKAVEPVGFVNRAAVNSAIIDRARGVGDTHTWSEKKTSFHSVPFYTSPQLREESRNKGWAVAKSLQAQVNILLPVVWAAADDDDEYGIGPKARKALEALAAHKET